MIFLMLIKVTATVKENPELVAWIDEIETNYMDAFGDLGASVAHLVLQGPWDFALVFPGSEESVAFLTSQISDKAPGQTDILTMPATDLDDFRARHSRA